jgi:hypothetical protein
MPWVLVRDQYDDGGISGGTLERPGLKQLLATPSGALSMPGNTRTTSW